MALRMEVLSALAILIIAPQANAAIIYSANGIVGGTSSSSSSIEEYYSQDTELTFYVTLPSTITTNALEPAFGQTRQIPPVAYPPLPTPQKYRTVISLPTTPVSVTEADQSDFWYDNYRNIGGQRVYDGGDDNINDVPDISKGYIPNVINGSLILTTDEAVRYYYSFGHVEFDWTGPSTIDVFLPNSALGEPWSFSISAVPEPAVWSILIIGFFGIGAALRRKRQTQC